MSLAKLHPRLRDFVTQKWKNLTPIQEAAFDPVFNGRSCTVEAPTSGGKTEAVLFPLLTRIAPDKKSGFKVLYIAPLKALLNDLALRVEPYAEKCYLKAFKWHGDVSQGDKVNQMLFPSDILLTTPESLEAILLRKGNWQEVFQALETIVIDEAHYFALTERGSHLVSLLERIEAGVNKRTQRIAVTATIGNPRELLEWIAGDDKGIAIKTDSKHQKERDFSIWYIDENKELLHDRLYDLLQKQKSIVFERSRSDTERTATMLNDRNASRNNRFPLKVRTHHSSVGKRMREEAEGSIKSSKESALDAIICTSTLELGIDIGDLDQVVQVGSLTSPGSFLQRVGRTGRREGRKQVFRGLCSDGEELLLLAGCVNLGLRHTAEPIAFPGKAFHILAHQVICLCLQKAGITAGQIWTVLSKAACFRKITREELNELVEYMIKEDWLRKTEGTLLLTSEKTEKEFLRSNWRRLFAIFDTGPMYEVVDGKKLIGTLDSSFVKSLGEPPIIFVLGGVEWFTNKIDHERQQVKVKKNNTGIAPKWKAKASFDIPFELAQETGDMLMSDQQYSFLDLTAQKTFDGLRKTYQDLQWTRSQIVYDVSGIDQSIYIWTFAGDKTNRALAHLLAQRLKVKFKYNYQHVNPEKADDITLSQIKETVNTLLAMTEKELREILEEEMTPVWFSKFSECIPASLAKKALSEKMYDLSNLVRLNQRNT